jgi:glycosyltransferase involved in cell wall biosynthesis
MAAKPLRVLAAGHDFKFFEGLQAALEETGRFCFRRDAWTGHDKHDERASRELLGWADVIFCEWCLGNAVWYAQQRRPRQRLLIRFHLAERNTPFPNRLALDRVDRVAFVGAHIEREAHQRLGLPPEKTCVVPNLVDTRAFDRPKYEGSVFNLGMVGIVPMRKRIDRALDILEALKQRDERYCLHIKGAHPSRYPWVWSKEEERAYYRSVWERINASPWGNSVVFDPPGNDVAEWFRMVGVLLSMSDFESFHLAVGEGMSSGTLPVVWNWEGAAEIWPESCVVASVDEAVAQIDGWRGELNGSAGCRWLRRFVSERYGRERVRDMWAELLDGGGRVEGRTR